jgi:hypothetical protein
MQLRAAAPTLDGSVAQEEWAGAREVANLDGVTVAALRAGEGLYISVSSDRGGILTVYVASGDVVRVLHASDAISEARYERSDGGAYRLAERWGEWDRSADTAGQLAFKTSHGWVSSIGPMGPRGEREFLLDVSRLPEGARIAISYAAAPEFETLLTVPEGLADGTALPEVQRGFLPETVSFQTDAWTTVDALASVEDGE